jgi:hypothetical protein
MVRETISAWHIIHAAEVREEILEGWEMGQEVADLNAPLIIFERSPAQDAVIRAELSIWRLKRVRKINLADDGRVFTNERQVVNHADQLCKTVAPSTEPAV